MRFSKTLIAVAALSIGGPAGLSSRGYADEHEKHQSAHSESKSADPQAVEKKISAALAKLPAEDRELAAQQRFCPVMEHSRLGEMGPPVKLTIEGKPVFVCCKSCVEDAKEQATATLEKAEALKEATAAMAELSAEDRKAAESQKYCAVFNDNLLGSMGPPLKIELNGKPVFLCCKGCLKKARANPEATLAKVAVLKKAGEQDPHAAHAHSHAEGSHQSKKAK